MAEVEPIQTGDGSLTGRHAETGATYRSVFGALNEVQHVFIESTGLASAIESWCVVELGFGLGTSFAETARQAHDKGIELTYFAVERDPAAPEHAAHPEERWRSHAVQVLERLEHDDVARYDGEGLSVTVLRTEWVDAPVTPGIADALYFDPFGPRVNPGSWDDAAFEMARDVLKPGGRLATYSAAGHVRRAMARSGLFLATRPGPGHKREITIASPSDEGLGDFERLSMERYNKRLDD